MFSKNSKSQIAKSYLKFFLKLSHVILDLFFFNYYVGCCPNHIWWTIGDVECVSAGSRNGSAIISLFMWYVGLLDLSSFKILLKLLICLFNSCLNLNILSIMCLLLNSAFLNDFGVVFHYFQSYVYIMLFLVMLFDRSRIHMIP